MEGKAIHAGIIHWRPIHGSAHRASQVAAGDRVLVYEACETLKVIQDGFKLELNGCSARWMSLGSFNCRLIQTGGDQLFLLGHGLPIRYTFPSLSSQ